MSCLGDFLALAHNMPAPTVLELGARQSRPGRSTLHRSWVPHAVTFQGTDFMEGADVDIVADVHALSEVTGENRFDIIISCSTFEHIQYPWIAAVEINRALKPGGLLFVQTHQSFPLHAFPYDYWRFSREALRTLFGPQTGFAPIGDEYEFKSHVFSFKRPWLVRHPSYLSVNLAARKAQHLGKDFVWKAETAK